MTAVRSLLADLRALNDRLSPDEAPMWAEVLGVVFAVGFYVRSTSHVFAALAADVNPELTDYDVCSGSPVAAIRTAEWPIDAGARILSLCAAVALWVSVDPLAVSHGSETTTLALRLYLSSNLAIAASDPLLFIYWRIKP